MVFCVGVPAQLRPLTGRAVGVDVGVASLAATSDGELIDNPRHLDKARKRLSAAQAALARYRRGSGRRRRAVERVAAVYRRVRNQRQDHLHLVSRRLVDAYDLIAVEDLAVGAMTRSARGTIEAPGTNVAAKRGLNRSILAAGGGPSHRCSPTKMKRLVGSWCESTPATRRSRAASATTVTRRTAYPRRSSAAGRAATRPTLT